MEKRRERRDNWINSLVCACSGAVTAVLFDLPAASFLCWVTLAPAFFVLLRSAGPSCLLRRCCITGFAFFAVYYAAFFTMDVSARMGSAGGFALAGGFLAATVLHGAILAGALFLSFRLPCPAVLRAILAGTLWAGAEWLMGLGVLGFPCMRLAATQAAFPEVLASLPLLGSGFLSFLIVAVNVLAAQGVALWRSSKKAVWFLALGAAVAAVNLAAGCMRSIPAPRETVRLAAVQYNMPSYRDGPEGRYPKAAEIARRAAEENPQIILLPENAVFGSFATDEALQRPLAELAEQSGAYVLAGVYGIYGYENRNSVFMVEPDGSIGAPYHKQRLVPAFENGYDQPFSLEIGEERGLFETEYGVIGAVICFESMFSDVVADTVGQGAELVCIFTNDSWFRGGIAPRRHFAHAVLRAAETGRYVVQAGNNGVTGCVAPDGRVLETLPMDRDGYLLGEVEFLEGRTPYLVIGDWWIAALLAVLAVCLAVSGRKRRKT